MALSKRARSAALMTFLVSFGALALGEGEALAQKKPKKKQPATSEPTTESTVEPATAPAATGTTTTTETPAADTPAEGKKELDTSVETAKAIYMSADLGFTRGDLGLLSNNTGFNRTGANGVLYGVAAGVRLRDLRLGLRWRVYDTTEFSLWTFALSAGYGLPIRPLSPVFSAHVGYVFDQTLQSGLYRNALPPGTVLPPDVDVKGLLAGVDVNLSYWVTQFLRLGVFAGADLMFLSREQAPLPRSVFAIGPEYANQPLYTDSGSGVGLNVNVGIRGAFDIGFH